MTRTMLAKYSGRCRQCGSAIEVGELIVWTKGRGAIHVTCAALDDGGEARHFASADPNDVNIFEPEDVDVCDAGHQYVPRRGQHGCPQCSGDYAAGLADGRRYHSDREIYGEALAERFAMDEEMARYNRGEDY